MLSKAEVQSLLEERNLARLQALAQRDKRVVRYVLRCLYSEDELLRKRAIEALGLICSVIAERDTWAVRNILRQLLWSVTEESGGIGWSAPEAMAEIVKHRPEEFYDYGSIAVSLLDEELLCRSGLWAVGTLGSVNPEFVKHVVKDIIVFLSNPDPTLRGYAARALFTLKVEEEKLELLKNDKAPVQVYVDGCLQLITVSELAGHKN